MVPPGRPFRHQRRKLMPGNHLRFARFVWLVLAYDVVVILWGAYVRATGSGAGCGAHWPLCNGEVVPRAAAAATLIEFTHRASSGLVLVLAVVVLVWARRAFAPGHAARRAAAAVMILTLTEALVGAGLVLFRLVGADASVARVASMGLHLVNTFLLLAALALTAARASRAAERHRRRATGRDLFRWAGIAAVVLVSVTGAVTALGDTLFPPGAAAPPVVEATAHFLVRLRLFHPYLAVVVGAWLLMLSGALPDACRRHAAALATLVIAQLGAGLVTVALHAPVAMQLVHLLLADLVWVTLILAVERARGPQPAPVAVAPLRAPVF
jgi:heme a synthase